MSERTVTISYQILALVPATAEDDPSMVNDWRSHGMLGSSEFLNLNVPGRLIQPINPPVATQTLGKPFYLFESGVLLAFAASLFDRLTMKDLKFVPKIAATKCFPYREASGMSHLYLLPKN